jgi:hypothetical protein
LECLDDDHSAPAAGASVRWRRCFSARVRLGGRTLGRGEQLADALDVVNASGSCEQAVVADAVEAARQHVQEKAADELGGRERDGLEAVAAFDAVVLTWGVPGQGAIRSCLFQLTWLVRFRSFGLCRRLSISRLWLLAAKMASGRRGSRMRSTGEAGVRGEHVLCAGHARRLGGASPLCNLMEVKH